MMRDIWCVKVGQCSKARLIFYAIVQSIMPEML